MYLYLNYFQINNKYVNLISYLSLYFLMNLKTMDFYETEDT